MSSDRGGGTELQDEAAQDGRGQDEPQRTPVLRRTGPDQVDDGGRIDDKRRGEGYPEQQQGVRQGHPGGQEGRQERAGVKRTDQSRPQVSDGRDHDTGGHEQKTGDRDQGRSSRKLRRDAAGRNGHV